MSDKAWNEIFTDLEPSPLRGRVSHFEAAVDECGNLKEAMEFCSAEFRRLAGDDGLHTLRGSAPDALAHLIEQIDGSFHDLPPVFESLETIFESHRRRLAELESQAASALARANTRWNAVQRARDNLDEADGALTAINNQIASLRNATDEASLAELEELESRLPTVRSARGTAASAVTSAERDLDTSRGEYRSIRDSEAELIGRTRDKIRDIDLRDLKDPGWLESKLESIGEFFADIAKNLGKAFEALLNGDFLDALHYLSDALNSILTVLAVIVIAVVVVVAVFATGGALLAVLTTVATILAASKLAIDAVLAGTGHPHPETGRPKTWRQVAVDAVLMVPIPGGRVLGRSISSRLLARVPPAGYSSRQAYRTYRQNQRIIAAAERGTGMGSRQNGNRLTARQVRERAVQARRYNTAFDRAHATHRANVDNAITRGHEAGDAGVGAAQNLASEGAKKAAEPLLAGQHEPFESIDVDAVADHPAVREGARRHLDRCRTAMDGYSQHGPTGRPGTPYVCLVPAG